MTTIEAAVEDLFDGQLPVEEAADRHYGPTFRQRTNGIWDDRAGFLARITELRELVEHAAITVLDELTDGHQYAERHLIELRQRDGTRIVQEVSVFAERDSAGRFVRIEETTRALDAPGAPLANTSEEARPSTSTTQLADDWLQLWNGDLQRADGLVAQHIQVHATSMDGSDSSFTGVDGLLAWITSVRAAFPDLLYTREVGPIAQGELLALRWSVAGTYAGGIPGSAAEVGTQVDFTGTDLLRVADGRLSEYWVSADLHVMLAQLQLQLPG